MNGCTVEDLLLVNIQAKKIAIFPLSCQENLSAHILMEKIIAEGHKCG